MAPLHNVWMNSEVGVGGSHATGQAGVFLAQTAPGVYSRASVSSYGCHSYRQSLIELEARLSNRIRRNVRSRREQLIDTAADPRRCEHCRRGRMRTLHRAGTRRDNFAAGAGSATTNRERNIRTLPGGRRSARVAAPRRYSVGAVLRQAPEAAGGWLATKADDVVALGVMAADAPSDRWLPTMRKSQWERMRLCI